MKDKFIKQHMITLNRLSVRHDYRDYYYNMDIVQAASSPFNQSALI